MATHPITAKDINALSGHVDPNREHGGETLYRLIKRLETRIRSWWLYRSTVAELGSLTDRQLADIGVTRGEIPSVARASAWRMTSW